MKRSLAGLLAVLLGANGVVMMFDGLSWYGVVPGVVTTGPYNPHFVKDIGAIYLVCAGALAWRAWKPEAGQGAIAAAAAFMVLHAGIHVADAAVCGNAAGALIRDLPGIFIPALLVAWLALPQRPSIARA